MQADEFLLPARFDGTEMPGLRPTVGYINLAAMEPQAFALLVRDKVMAGLGRSDPQGETNDGGTEGFDRRDDPGIKEKAVGTRFVEAELPIIVRKAQVSGILPSAVFIDIDDLTVINKKYGRPVGDLVLDTVFQLVRTHESADAALTHGQERARQPPMTRLWYLRTARLGA